MRLEKLEVCDLWSYSGPDRTLVSAFGQVNVVIGRNNVGKSNLMRAIRWVTGAPDFDGAPSRDYAIDKAHIYNTGAESRDTCPSLRLTFSMETPDWANVSDPVIQKLFRSASHCLSGKLEIGFETSDGRGAFVEALPADHKALAACCDQTATSEEDALSAMRKTGLQYMRENLILLDGWRRLTDPVKEAATFFEFFHGLQSAMDDPQAAYKCRDRIEKFFCELTGLNGAEIHVRADKRGFNVTVNKRVLPLSAFGDGISHLFMIAAKAALHDHAVILVEEPETHLHPDLQRHLIRFFAKTLSAQIILTTHSPVLLDTSWADKIIRVQHSGDQSFVSAVDTPKSVYSVLDELGARASDILQANLVIWVEGPSDRTFLKRCLTIVAPEFTEGLHFQIVCYGGALRAHLTFADKVEELVDLVRLARHVVMVCDSDKEQADDTINATKERLKKECEAIDGLYWITEGREIENYLSNEILTRSYRELLEDETISISLGQFERLADVVRAAVGDPGYGDKWKADYDNHKPELMSYFMDNVHSAAELGQYDLLGRLDQIRHAISEANNYLPSSKDV